MRNNKNHYLLSLFLSALMLTLYPLESMALEYDGDILSKATEELNSLDSVSDATASDCLLSIEESILRSSQVNGVSGRTTEELFSYNQERTLSPEYRLSEVALGERNGKLIFQAKLQGESGEVELNSTGILYKNTGTETEKAYENVLLAEMEDSGNIHFVQLRIDKEYKKILLTLQEKDSFTLMYFEIPITDAIFEGFGETVQNELVAEELEEKMRELYIINRNILNRVDDSSSQREMSALESSQDELVEMQTRSYNGWQNLIRDLDRYGRVNLNNYSGSVDTSFFKGGGWHYDDVWGVAPYSFVSYSGSNGASEYMTQFALMDITHENNSSASTDGIHGIWNLGICANYISGMTVSYNRYTGILSVHDRVGIWFDNYRVGMNGLKNKAVFIRRLVEEESSSGSNVVRAAISVFSPFVTLSNVFQNLREHTYQEKSYTQSFDGTYERQYNKYGGKVIRGIMSETLDRRLKYPGHKIGVSGRAIYKLSLGSYVYFGYTYRCYHSI